MKRTFFALAIVGLFAVGCSETDPTTPMPDGLGVTPQAAMGPVVHFASVGGADACSVKPGCDANFSLVAKEFADGTVTGQWHDQFSGGEGIHVAVDCLNVVGNGAVVGGMITHGSIGGVDVSGGQAVTAVVDNGTSANDAADQISFSWINFTPPGFCAVLTPDDFLGFLFDATGQVTVR